MPGPVLNKADIILAFKEIQHLQFKVLNVTMGLSQVAKTEEPNSVSGGQGSLHGGGDLDMKDKAKVSENGHGQNILGENKWLRRVF